MKNINILLFAATAAFMTSCGGSDVAEETEVEIEPVTYSLNVEASNLEWQGKKNQGNDKHVGYVKFNSGSAVVTGDVLTSGEFVIDMNSIATSDALPAEVKEKLNGHLKNEDFFNVAKYPTATVKVGEMKDGKLSTTVSLMGMEFKNDIPVKVVVKDDKVNLSGTFDFDFTGLKSMGFMADPATGEQILSIFSFDLNLELTK